MATYKKGWTPEEKKIIEVSKKTTKSVFDAIKSSMFPFEDFSFEDFKETFLYRYIRNFILGLLLISILILVIVLFGAFVTWSLPKIDTEPMSEWGKMFSRGVLLCYAFFILFITGSEGD